MSSLHPICNCGFGQCHGADDARFYGYQCAMERIDQPPPSRSGNPLPLIPQEMRQLAAALEATISWCWARELPGHIKVGFLGKHAFCDEYVNAVAQIRQGVRIAKKLGFRFKSLEGP